MKVSESWLREWINPDIDSQTLVEQLTMAGVEVDALAPVAGDFSGVFVGEIVSIEPHPDADKLRVCQVAGGPEGNAQVVCGAPNARAGLKAPFAIVGAKLPGDFTIKKAKLRGIASLGMLCGQTELNAGDDDSGLWELAADAPVGTDLREYLGLDDNIIDIDITPNRGDCLSVRGLARELGVLNRQAVNAQAAAPVAAAIDDTLEVKLDAGDACSHYVGRVIRNIDASKPSPLWLQEKLRRAGLRSIDAVVDVTNYVLLEQGQPMHAFDLHKINGAITVREAGEGEQLVLLDEQEVSLAPGTLVISDAKAPLAIAGIMGGKASAVSAGTRDIFLESAFFNPVAIAGRARRYGLHTDSSHRFERGVDYQLQDAAIERATALLLDIVGGEPGPVVAVKNDHLPSAKAVTLRRARIASDLYINMDDATVEDILTRLGLDIRERTDEGWRLGVPSWRFDIAIEADLLEELARIYGYNRLPTRVPDSPMAIKAHRESRLSVSRLRRHLISRGLQEVLTYSFIDPQDNALFDPNTAPIDLKNPISADMAVMRTTLLPGLVNTLRYNLNRQCERVRLFETGQRFVPGEQGVAQEPTLAGLIYGAKAPESWANSADAVDFFDMKGDLESLLGQTGAAERFSFSAAEHPALHPGQCAELHCDGQSLGFVGALHPQLQKQLDIPAPVYVFEITLQPVLEAALPSFTPLSRFPAVRRDLALLVERDLPVQALLESIRNSAGEYLTDLKVFDLYMGKGIDPHRKSIALGLTFQHPSRTLNDEEINAAMQAVMAPIQEQFGATLR